MTENEFQEVRSMGECEYRDWIMVADQRDVEAFVGETLSRIDLDQEE